MAGPLYFAWVASDSVTFDAGVHNVMDETIKRVVRSQAEGEAAKMLVTIVNPGVVGLLASTRQQHALVSYDFGSGPQLIFRGKVVGWPDGLQGQTATIELRAQSDDYEDDLLTFANTLKTGTHYNALFYTEAEKDEPTAIIRGRAQHYHIDRLTNAVSAVDYLPKVTPDLTIDGVHEYSTVDVSFAQPISKIDVSVRAEWVQSADGLLGLGSWLRQRLGGNLASFKGDTLFNMLPKTGQRLGGGWVVGAGDYTVGRPVNLVLSAVRRTYATVVGGNIIPGQLDRYSDVCEAQTFIPGTSRLTAGGQSVAGQHPILRWSYRQARNEQADVTVQADLQDLDPTLTRAETREFLLRDITLDSLPLFEVGTSYTTGDQVKIGGRNYEALQDHTGLDDYGADFALFWQQIFESNSALVKSSAATFFARTNGRSAISHAVQIAEAEIKQAARCLTVSAKIKFSTGWQLDPTSTVTINDPRLPGGTATGKVVSIEDVIDTDGGNLHTNLTLGCVPGNGGSQPGASSGSPVALDATAAQSGVSALSNEQYSTDSGIAWGVRASSLAAPVNIAALNNTSYAITSFNVVGDYNGTNRNRLRAVFNDATRNRLNDESRRSALTNEISGFDLDVTINLRDLAPSNVLERSYTVGLYDNDSDVQADANNIVVTLPKSIDLEATS